MGLLEKIGILTKEDLKKQENKLNNKSKNSFNKVKQEINNLRNELAEVKGSIKILALQEKSQTTLQEKSRTLKTSQQY